MPKVLKVWVMTLAAISFARALPSFPALDHSSGPSLILSTNATSLLIPLVSPPIYCYSGLPGRDPTSIGGCRPTLNYIRQLPQYRKVQYFQEGRYPTEPSKPPYYFFVPTGDCGINVSCGSRQITDNISFEQIRAAAIDILEHCQEKGYGGVMPIGRGIGWTVKIIGFTAGSANETVEAGGDRGVLQ